MPPAVILSERTESGANPRAPPCERSFDSGPRPAPSLRGQDDVLPIYAPEGAGYRTLRSSTSKTSAALAGMPEPCGGFAPYA